MQSTAQVGVSGILRKIGEGLGEERRGNENQASSGSSHSLRRRIVAHMESLPSYRKYIEEHDTKQDAVAGCDSMLVDDTSEPAGVSVTSIGSLSISIRSLVP